MPLQVKAIIVQGHTTSFEWGSVMHTQGNSYRRPTLYFRQYAENHDKPWWVQPALGPKCDPKFSEYKRGNLLNTKQSLKHTFGIIHTSKHMLKNICSEMHIVYDSVFGIQTAYNTANYPYIKCRFSCYPPYAMRHTYTNKAITCITQYV